MPTRRTPVDVVADKPKVGTPTAVWQAKKTNVGGVLVCMKGESLTGGGNEKSPYRERAAYLVANMIGLHDLVPPTALHTLKGKVVSIQKWVSGDKPEVNQPNDLRLFDYIIANTDRHNMNWLTRRNGKVWAIDNAYSFNDGVLVYRPGTTPIDTEILTRIERLLLQPWVVDRILGKLLSAHEIEGVMQRLANVDVCGCYLT